MTSTSPRPRHPIDFSAALLIALAACVPRPAAAESAFVRGDADGNGIVDISDAIAVLGCLYNGGACPTCDDAADADDNGALEITDPVRVLSYLYLGDSPPPPPAACGADPTADDLSCKSFSRCGPIEPVKFLWPLSGANGEEWVITSYVDLDRDPGALEDYTGATGAAARVIDQHNGVDIDVPDFRAMDADFPVLAAADGVVVGIRDGQADRNTSREEPCGSVANFVVVEHADGTQTHYRHLKKDSLVVKVGQEVAAGEKLAVVGSSGCSAQPHLHFEVRNRSNNIIDPFRGKRWIDPPAYEMSLVLMGVSVKAGGFSSNEDVKDPPSAVLEGFVPESTVGIGLTLAGGSASERVDVELRDPDGLRIHAGTIVADGVRRHTFHRVNFVPRKTGRWILAISVNGADVHRSFINVHHPIGHQVFGLDLGGEALEQNLNDDEFRPVAVDAHTVGNEARYNVVKERAPGVRWTLLRDIPASLIQPLINTHRQLGFRVSDLDIYLMAGQVRFLALLTDEVGPDQELLLGFPEPSLDSMLANLINRDFLPVDLSVVDLGGGIGIAAAICERRGGTAIHQRDLTSAQYKTAFQQEFERGNRLLSLDARTDALGTPRFTVVWGTRDTGKLAVRLDRSRGELSEDLVELAFRQRLKTRLITSYMRGDSVAFAGFWSER